MQVVNVCMCMHACVCGWGGERRIYDKIQDFVEFHVVSNIFGWLPVYSLCEEFKASWKFQNHI